MRGASATGGAIGASRESKTLIEMVFSFSVTYSIRLLPPAGILIEMMPVHAPNSMPTAIKTDWDDVIYLCD
jgi:hypothetical protein